MSSNNEETLKKWANVLQSNNLTQLCPILTAEENIQQTGGSVPVPPLKENIFQLPVPWRKVDDVHPYQATVQPLSPVTFTPSQTFPKPKLAPGGGSRSQCTCQCKTIPSPMGQSSAQAVGPTSSIKPTSQCLTKPMLWKDDDDDEPICTCPKIPSPLIKPDPKRPFVKCECNELMRNVAPTNYKCSQPKPEVKMKAFLAEETKSEAPPAGPDQSSTPQKSGESVKDKDEKCCCCEEGTKKDGKDKSEKQEESEKEKAKNKNGDNKKDTSGSDDKKTIKKHGKEEVEKRKNNGNKDKKTEKGSMKEENKEISGEKEKMENKKKQNDSTKSVSSSPSSDNKTESSKSKSVKKLAADKKDSSNEQASPDSSPSIDESKKGKKGKNEKKDKKSKKETDVKKETKEKRGKESDCLKRINELTSKLPPDFVADFAQGMYPGMKVGHATCCLPSIRIPCKMGWLWNSCEGAGSIKPDLGWRPGAIRSSTFSAMKAGRKLVKQNKLYEEEDIMSDDKVKGDGDQGRKDDLDDDSDDSDLDDDDEDEFEGEDGKGKRRRSKASVTTKEQETEDQTKPTLHLHKTKGQYFISMYTPDEKEKEKEDEGRVLMTFNRKTLEIASSASSTSSGKSSTVTEDSMELDYTTPYALYKQAKRAEKCNRQTQWNRL